MKNTLFLFTADFPFGTGETFLETEIKYLSEGFEKIIIISRNMSAVEMRPVPENCEIRRIDLSVSKFQKMSALAGLLDARFWKERAIIKTVYNKKINKGIISTMLISLFRAKKVERYAELLYRENQQDSKLFFYSYWCDDVAIGLAMLQRELPELRTFSRIHGWDMYFEASELNYLPYRHFIADNLKSIFAISQKGLDYTQNCWKISKPNVVQVSRLGVKMQNQIIPDENESLLASCSNVIPLKLVDLIVRSLALIKDRRIKWVHFGDGSMLDEVKLLADNLLPENIQVEFKGRIDNNEVLNWYAENHTSLFINVSATEGIPVSIMEAMSFGIPVIATDVGGTNEIVNSVNGILLPPDPNADFLRQEIEGFFELSKSDRMAKQNAAFETWERLYNAEVNYKVFIDKVLKL